MEIVREDEGGPDPLLARFEEYLRRAGPALFQTDRPITVARAPGRIDCMGGIADYSGSAVFEGPLRQAAVVACQEREDDTLVARSATLEENGAAHEVKVPLEELRRRGRIREYPDLSRALTSDPETAWAAYLLGVVAALEREEVHRCDCGVGFLLWSDVPIGVGVASSAAVEVAAMYALSEHLGLELEATRLAELCQIVENRVVGAPCGIMDQVTSACGETGKLLAMRCQPPATGRRPIELLGQHELPEGVRVFGLSSRVEHRVSGSAYARARVSAFMGLKIILREREKRGRLIGLRDHYLCNLSPDDYVQSYRSLLPEGIVGAEFLKTWGETTDEVTSVDPDTTYRVQAGTDHPIFENGRVRMFIDCIDRARSGDRTALVECGGLMYASHWSYGWNCDLDCEETDLLVRLVQRRGPEHGFYGAKVTGGGSGGTVAILADAAAEDALEEIAEEYAAETGLEPDVFAETGPGAYQFGSRRYRLEGAGDDG
ncbi:MAG: GHMP kinase [Planctomycetota bacterium]